MRVKTNTGVAERRRLSCIPQKSFAVGMSIILLALAGCSLNDLVGKNALPPDVKDPDLVKTEEGAIGAYYYAQDEFARAFAVGATSYVNASGLFTDELQVNFSVGAVYPTSQTDAIDSRTLDEDVNSAGVSRAATVNGVFSNLYGIRVATREAIGALRQHAADEPPSLLGHMYALEAFAEVLLAELFCSGVPLTTISYGTNYVTTGAFSTEEVYGHALTLLDSAGILATDSSRISHFVNLVRSRALLGLGDYAAAAVAVSSVPSDYTYTLSYGSPSLQARSIFQYAATGNSPWGKTVADRKGQNGLPYVSSGDPRTATISLPPSAQRFPQKYRNDGSSPLIASSGVEARLIMAEAYLHDGKYREWLQLLNALRTDGTFTTAPRPGSPDVIDTTWGPGEGVALFRNLLTTIPGLRPLTDPGSDTARVSLLFAERAYWLHLTGYRQGDLRRLVRQYNRPQETVYPTGPWGPLGLSFYGTDINFPTPYAEQRANDKYKGCIDRAA